jgi:thiamine kinase-like enzyme
VNVLPTDVFGLIQRWSKLEITSIQSIGGRNKVWLASTAKGAAYVIKIFEKNSHGESHFLAEQNFLERNQHFKFIPEILHSEPELNLIVTRHYASDKNTQVTFSQMIEAVDLFSESSFFETAAHQEPPGVLNWGISENKLETNTANLLINLVRSSSWFEPLLVSCNEIWSSSSVIHGDLKLGNLILGKETFTIVDWENVSKGNKNWDIAGLIQGIANEIFSNGSYSNWARAQLMHLQDDYLHNNEEIRLFTALRSIQTGTELCQNADMVPENAVRMVQLAEDLIEDGFDISKGLGSV